MPQACCIGGGQARKPHRGAKMQKDSRCVFLAGMVLILALTDAECLPKPGRRTCSIGMKSRTVSYLTTHAQPVHQPYLTLCQGYRLCSTYRTIYRAAQRPAYRKVSQPAYACCPGWMRRANAPPGQGCNLAICRPSCQNGGKCLSPNKCACPAGWSGKCCQTDVDECAGGSHGCSQACLNVDGSFRCACREGYRLGADGKSCQVVGAPTGATSPAGTSDLTRVEEIMKALQSRLAALEDKFQLMLEPFLKLEVLEGVGGDARTPLALLIHSLQQLDRIDSLSEQISFLEERLETCSCKNEG